MNILICDDDKLYIDMIRKYVDEFFADHKITDYKVYEYNSGDEAAKNNEKIDIAFLDVEMDGINGIEAGKCLRNNNKNIVLFIITSYMGYLDDAMDEGVFRYINKPLERPVIMRGLHKALLLCSKSQSKKINIEYKGDNVIIEQDSIICIESLVRKRYIKTDTKSYISLKSLSYWQSVLDEDKFYDKICFGYDKDNLYLRFYINEYNKQAAAKTKRVNQMYLYTRNQNKKQSLSPIRIIQKTESILPISKEKFHNEMQISIYDNEINLVRLVKAIPNNLWVITSSKNITAVYDKVADISIPFDDIGIDKGDTLEFLFVNANYGVKDYFVPNEMLLTIKRV